MILLRRASILQLSPRYFNSVLFLFFLLSFFSFFLQISLCRLFFVTYTRACLLLHRVVIDGSRDDCEGERERERVVRVNMMNHHRVRLFFRAFAKKSCDIWLEAFSCVVHDFVVVVVFFLSFLFSYREIDTVELFSTKLLRILIEIVVSFGITIG